MKGSMLFNKDINIEVDVDPSAEEGARLSSAKNLVDGQELGTGGGTISGQLTATKEGDYIRFNKTYDEVKEMLENGVLPYWYDSEGLIWDNFTGCFYLGLMEENAGSFFTFDLDSLKSIFFNAGDNPEDPIYIYLD